MSRFGIVVAAVLAGAGAWGCKSHDELVVDVICESVCPCLVDPVEVEQCLAQCPQSLDPADVSDECFACVTEASDACPTIIEDCDPLCAVF